MEQNRVWLQEFEDNIDNHAFLKERINVPSWLHLSRPRLLRLLDQIDRKTGRAGTALKGWPRIQEKFENTPNADSMFFVLELGLVESFFFQRVLELVIRFIDRPSLRLYLEPLLEETLFVIRSQEVPELAVLEYHLNFKWTIDKGVLSWTEIEKNYNEFVLAFQCFVHKIEPESRLVVATIKQLNDVSFLETALLQISDESLGKITGLLIDSTT
jgi:hypothetical protein